jgi:hypothetical protein
MQPDALIFQNVDSLIVAPCKVPLLKDPSLNELWIDLLECSTWMMFRYLEE